MTIEITSITKLANNPYRGLNYVVDNLEKAWFDQKVNINSGTHPVVFCADLTIGVGFGFLSSLSDAISQVFPAHARSVAELSRNMNDIEYYGLFGTPSTSTINLIIAMDNLKAFAPTATSTVNGVNLSYQKMLIPKDTEVDVAGYTFAIENGIEIRYNERTGVQVVYDSTTNNPFNAIAGNVLKRKVRPISGKDYLVIEVPVRQLACSFDSNIPSTEGAGCSGRRAYSDYLYGIRAYITGTDGVKREMVVAYDKAVFDPGTLTMTIDLDTSESAFDFAIPDIYIENGLGIGTVSLYVYTTKGTVDKDFTATDLNDYKPAYRDFRYANNDLNAYSDFLPNMGGVLWKFHTPISGGTIPTSFSKIKYGVVNGRRMRSLPITENNLIGSVEDYGYSAVKSIDFVTSRLFSLTKELPLQSNKDFYSGVNCFVGTNLISAKQLVNSGVALDNGARVTVPAGTMFDVTSQVPTLVSASQRADIAAMTHNGLIAYMESTSLAYLPFHYVFDTTQNQAAIRMYYLDKPKFGIQSFQDENTNLGIEVGIDAVTVTYENNGYTIMAQTSSGQSYKVLTDEQVGMQLSVMIAGSNQPASLKGELAYKTAGGERVYRFRMESNLDVDESDQLHITNFSQYGSVQPDTPIALDLEVSFIVVRRVGTWQTVISADSEIDQSLFKDPVQAIIKTNLELVLGKRLDRIYNRVRPLVGEGQYQQYDFNVPDVYDEDVYKKENGQLVLGSDNLPILLHSKGEPMLTDAGYPIYKHQKGDWVKDAQGNYVELAPRELNYHWDFVGFDGVYALSKDDYDIVFAQTIKDMLADTISLDLDLFSQQIIDKTRLLYQPKSKLGWRKVVVNSNYYSVLKQDLSFEVTYYLTRSGYQNSNLKTSLKNNTPKVLNNFLFNNITVGVSSLVKALMENLPSDVVDVKINAVSGDSTVDVISAVDELSGFSVRKKLVLGDNKLPSVQEDVKVDFLQHDVTSL